MATSLSSQIQDVLPKTQDTYYKLILAVGPARAGKTAALTELAANTNGQESMSISVFRRSSSS